MRGLSGILALVALLTFGIMSPLAFAGEGEKGEDDKGNAINVVVYGDDEKKDDGGN